MATQFTFLVSDKPGVLATISEAIGQAGINIDGIAGVTCNGQGALYVLTNDTPATEAALNGTGIPFKKEEVLIIHLKDRPGEAAKLCKELTKEGINLSSFYMTMDGFQVLGSDNMSRTKEIAANLGVI